ncbi:hypothetical protein D9M71_702180 [compost metagenome]
MLGDERSKLGLGCCEALAARDRCGWAMNGLPAEVHAAVVDADDERIRVINDELLHALA